MGNSQLELSALYMNQLVKINGSSENIEKNKALIIYTHLKS